MQYLVMRVFDGGRRLEKHARLAGRTRGSLAIHQETDNNRRRAILVARLAVDAGQRPAPPLHDVTLIGTSGEAFVLTGIERIEAGPLAREYAVGQTWIVEPVQVQDLLDAEQKWRDSAREVELLREQLRCLTQSSGITAGG
jgi:hypothetical protein